MSAPVRLYLTRHGRTSWNQSGRFQGHSDIALDEVGRAQAETLARSLAGQVDAVIASDLLRASETARILAATLGIPLLALDPDLRERGYGVFEGLTREECVERHPAAWAARNENRNFEPPGSEPHALVVARMRRALANAVALLQGSHASAVVVGHGSSLRMFIETLTDVPVTPIGNMEFRQILYDGGRFLL